MDDFGSPMALLGILPLASAILPLFISLSLFGPVVLYVIARWRAQRAPIADPQLGLKFALHWFATSALHVALVGGVILIFTTIGPNLGPVKGNMYRVAFGLLVPAGIVLGVHVMLLRRTNDDQMTGVRRLFLGYNLLITGAVGFAALVMGFVLLFAKGSTGGAGHLAGAAILVYCGAWAALGFRFSQLVLMFGGSDGQGGGYGGIDQIVPPPQAPPSAAAGGGGLPPLGGGSYPPIEPR